MKDANIFSNIYLLLNLTWNYERFGYVIDGGEMIIC